jgi:hypothetical protein
VAKSEAQKKLAHKLRQGLKLDPRASRGNWGNVKPITKVRPNKKREELYNDSYQ